MQPAISVVTQACSIGRENMNRQICRWLLLALASIPFSAAAQNFPARPVRIVIPYPPAGGVDSLVRSLSATVSASMGQQLIIDTRPGGSSIIGTEVVAKSP